MTTFMGYHYDEEGNRVMRIKNMYDLRTYIADQLQHWDMSCYTLEIDELRDAMAENMRDFIGKLSEEITQGDLIKASEEFEIQDE